MASSERLLDVALAVARGAQSGPIPDIVPGARRGCTVADLRGVHGFYRAGTTPQGPIGAVGTDAYDGRGHKVVSQMTSRNGVLTQGNFDASYEINADCAGRWVTPDGQGLIGYFVLVDDGNEIYFLSTSAGNTITGVAKRISR